MTTSSGIEIEQTQEPGKVPPPGGEGAPGTGGTGISGAELEAKLAPLMLDAAINVLGTALAKISKLDGMDFTPEEHKALVDAWTPLLPLVPVWWNAALVTLIVLGGKGVYYVQNRPRKASAAGDTESPAAKEGKPGGEGSSVRPTD